MTEQYPDGVRTPDEIHADTLDNPATPPAQAEVLAETGPRPVKTVPIELPTGVTIQVPMMSEWRSSALEYMRAGDFDSWAESVLSDADMGAWDEWMDSDPKLGDLRGVMGDVGKATGEAAAGNRALRRSLRRTRMS